jgi:hypothetical protein
MGATRRVAPTDLEPLFRANKETNEPMTPWNAP